MKTGVLIINLGTPNSPRVADVRRYLREFLMDSRVIDIPYLRRFFLVQSLIVPFRSRSSAKAYQQLWTEKGSPLKVYGYEVREHLQEALGDSFSVSLAMRYQQPSIQEGLAQLKKESLKQIVVLPLYPQYASASSGSTHEAVMNHVASWEVIPDLHFISKFFEHPDFIHAFTSLGKEYLDKNTYDHIVFSYHGLPERQIRKAACKNYCQLNDTCCANYHQLNEYCYRAQCFETSRLLASSLKIHQEQYTVSFQSRLGRDPWIKPYTDEVITQLAAHKVQRVLVFSPSFVADCLETTVEIADEYKELFLKAGGQELTLVQSLNTHPLWIQCLKSLVLETLRSNKPISI